ncbi:MAG: hypothetical protein ACTHJH_15925 [Marmoricola sp.]
MIMLLAIPVIAAVALAHRYLLLYAPSNVLTRRVRAARPTLSTAAAMVVLATVLLVAMKVVSDAVAAGAPGWLNLVVLVLAWDVIRIGLLALHTILRWLCSWHRRAGDHAGRFAARNTLVEAAAP